MNAQAWSDIDRFTELFLDQELLFRGERGGAACLVCG